MLLRDLTKVYISEYETINNYGEKLKKWKYKDIAWLNLQQDVNELDRNSAGAVDYSIVNARTTMNYNIQKGNGISLTDISKSDSFVPDYTVSDNPKIGSTIIYKLKQYNGEVEEDEY
jgi:hypothetical protein